jgi:regulator of protease activity HflC (stomatin/prohibitin superfamily)
MDSMSKTDPRVAGLELNLPEAQVSERPARTVNGWLMLGLLAVLGSLAGYAAVAGGRSQNSLALATGSIMLALVAIAFGGFSAVSPGQARVVQLLGRYRGTVRTDGLQWVNPFTSRRKISVRIRNHETGIAKVNDAEGNPIEIAAVVVWKVEDTARAVFEVDEFVDFVSIQTETAVRHIAGSFPYGPREDGKLSLLDGGTEITEMLSAEIGLRVAAAGVRIVESRITRLSYAPEIARAMLRRQQATAVVAARSLIVEGAVGMVQHALERLTQDEIVDLDEERKAAMVSNLLVVLCGDRDAQPVVNAGSLYN